MNKVLINLDVCRKCYESFGDWFGDVNGSPHDRWIIEGIVVCPINQYGNPFHRETQNLYMEPREHCPYKLEHTVLSNVE